MFRIFIFLSIFCLFSVIIFDTNCVHQECCCTLHWQFGAHRPPIGFYVTVLQQHPYGFAFCSACSPWVVDLLSTLKCPSAPYFRGADMLPTLRCTTHDCTPKKGRISAPIGVQIQIILGCKYKPLGVHISTPKVQI